MSDGADQIELTHCCTEACETLVNSVIQGRLSREVFPEKLRELGLSVVEGRDRVKQVLQRSEREHRNGSLLLLAYLQTIS